MEVKLEYLGEDKSVAGAKIWKVEAIHVTTTRNKRKFTLTELKESARSLAFRGLNRNHEENRQLPWPENTTRNMTFNQNTMAVEGTIRVADPDVNALIEAKKIIKLSIEQIPMSGESCNDVSCEQHGVVFIGLALLDEGIVPGDEGAEIKGFVKSERAQKALSNYETISDLLVSDEQRTCHDCSDNEACHECKHKMEAGDICMEKTIREIQHTHPEFSMNQILAEAVSKCGVNHNEAEAWAWWNRYKPLTEAVIKQEIAKMENLDPQMSACLEQVQRDHPEMIMDDRVLHCLEALNRLKDGNDNGVTININAPTS